MAIEWIEVRSSNIAAIAYAKETSSLLVQFTNSRVYSYDDVPEQVFEDFKAANSKGKFLNEHIKDVYQYEKLS